jgi:long-chain acyl-CoA synthetase
MAGRSLRGEKTVSDRLDALVLCSAAAQTARLATVSGQNIGFAALEKYARALASRLTALGVQADEPVILHVRNEPSDLAGFLGIWQARAVAVPIHTTAAPATLATLRSRTGARLEINESAVVSTKISAPAQRGNLSGAAVIVFTSGSTGQPKGVIVGHAALAFKLRVLSRLLRLSASDTIVCPLQMTFIFGQWTSVLGLLSGAHVLFVPRFSTAAMMDALPHATVLAAVPTMLRAITGGNRPQAPALRMILTGGEAFGLALAPLLKAAFPAAGIYDLYGLTETGSCDFCLLPSDQPYGLGTIGRPTEGVAFRIQSVRSATVPGSGELQIRTPARMLAYLDDAVATAAAFDGDYFRTGDLACVREDGLVTLIGRSKEIISRGANKIAPLQIDNLFAQHDGVAAALSFGVPDARLGEALHLIVVRREGTQVSAEDLRAWAADRIERFKIPDAIHFRDALPLGRTGKADRQAAIEAILSRTGS